jgi:hypothetical protein
MSSEVSLAKPLSGTECLEAILYRIREVFAKDERFYSHMAYTGFNAQIDFKFYPQNSFIPPVERSLVVAAGETDDLSETPSVEESITLDLAPPNKVREDADLPTPVLITHNDGTFEEKWIKRRGRPPKQNIPTNKGTK